MVEILKRVKEFIIQNNLIKENEVVACGLSGGADSIMMTYALNKLSKEMNFKIIAVHINHMLRGEDSIKDEEFVKIFCNNYGIELKVYNICVQEYSEKHKISIEMAGREVRYNVYNELKEKNIVDKCATAHHIDDDVETILMRLFKGTGSKGIEGIQVMRDNFYIRPVLFLRKSTEIIPFLAKNEIMFRLDKSNLEQKFLRNKLRISVIPLINKCFNKDIASSIMSFKKISVLENNFIDGLVEKEIDKYVVFKEDGVTIYDDILKLHKAVSYRLLREVILRFFGNITDISYAHIDIIHDLYNKKEGKYIEVKKGVYFQKFSNYIKATNSIDLSSNNLYDPSKKDEIVVLNKDEIHILKLGEKNEIVKEFEFLMKKIKVTFTLVENKDYNKLDLNSLNYKYFSFDDIYSEITIRTRRPGDVFKPFGMGNHKKLKDFFINEKIKDKNSIPIIIFDGNIGWVYGLRSSDDYKILEFTNKVIKIEIEYI